MTGDWTLCEIFVQTLARPVASDTQGDVTDENFWIRSYSNDTYLWYSELPDIDPGTVNSAEDYFDLMVT